MVPLTAPPEVTAKCTAMISGPPGPVRARLGVGPLDGEFFVTTRRS